MGEEEQQELSPEQVQDLQKYYEALFAMFGTMGWRHLMEDVANMHVAHNTLAGLETVEQLHFRKGQLDMTGWMMSLQERVEEAYKELADDLQTQAQTRGGKAQIVEPGQESEE